MRTSGRFIFTILALALLASVAAWAAPDDLSDRLESMKPEEQLEYLRGLEADGRQDATLYFHIGNAYFSLDSLMTAVGFYEKAVAADSTHSKAWVNMGLAYDASGKVIEARRSFNAAIDVNPSDVLAYCHLGHTYFTRGNVSKSIGYYTKALEIDSNSAQAHYNLGLAFAEAKVFREALLEWELVVKLDPDSELGKTAAENVELIKTYLELDGD